MQLLARECRGGRGTGASVQCQRMVAAELSKRGGKVFCELMEERVFISAFTLR